MTHYNTIIIGAGIAGLTAAIYSARAGKSTLVLESTVLGGQIIYVDKVENYPALSGKSGVDIITATAAQATGFGAQIRYETVKSITPDKTVVSNLGEYTADKIIIAIGITRSKLGVPGEEKFTGRGVSYCAICDGAFYKDKTAVVVGGSKMATEDVAFLKPLCQNVIQITDPKTIAGIKGSQTVNAVLLTDGTEISANAVFIAVGLSANSSWLPPDLNLTPKGFITTDENMRTALPGIYAAGDIRQKRHRQLVTAAADGCIAALD